MQHPTPPPTVPLPEKPQFTLSRARRRKINDDLELPQVGLAVAVNHPPGERPPHLTIVKLPRASAGKPRRGGVHIPRPAHMQKGKAVVSKHARQQRREGKFGNKGKATMERKLEVLNVSRAEALILAAKRTLRRASRYLAFERVGNKFRAAYNAAMKRAAAVVGYDRLQEATRA